MSARYFYVFNVSMWLAALLNMVLGQTKTILFLVFWLFHYFWVKAYCRKLYFPQKKAIHSYQIHFSRKIWAIKTKVWTCFSLTEVLHSNVELYICKEHVVCMEQSFHIFIKCIADGLGTLLAELSNTASLELEIHYVLSAKTVLVLSR